MKRYTLLACLLLVALPSAAGARYDFEVTDLEKSIIEKTVLMVEGRNLKIESGKGKGDMFYRGDRGEIVVVDHDEQAYYVINKETAKTIAARANDTMALMDQALANVPPDQQAAIKKMMQQQMPQAQAAPERPKTELKKTGERATHSGYPCVKWEVLRDGRKIRELWVTDWNNLEGGAEVAEVFEEMAEFFEEIRDSVPMFGEGGGADQPFFELMKGLGGFAVVARDLDDDGDLVMLTVLSLARTQNLNLKDDGPPSEYKRREMFGGQ